MTGVQTCALPIFSGTGTGVAGVIAPALQLAGGAWGLHSLAKNTLGDKKKKRSMLDYAGPAALWGGGLLAGGIGLGQRPIDNIKIE